MRGAYDRVNATWLSGIARYRGSSLQSFSRELSRVLRELDDVRALTWSADLSDSLGRFQTQVRRLIEEVDAGARQETGGHREPAVLLETRGCTVRPSVAAAGNWPYLAF